MKTTVEHITPKLALAYLAKNLKRNRPVSAATVASYTAEMQHGHWLLTHQGIAFDDAGHLIDGQHRLHAIVKSGVTVDMAVTRDVLAIQTRNGVSAFAFDALDRLRMRHVGQALELSHGRKYGPRLVACANTILRIANRSAMTASVPTVLKVLSIYEEHIDALMPLAISAYPKSLRVAAIHGTLAFARSRHRKSVDIFAKQAFTGDNIRAGDPAKALRFFSDKCIRATKQGQGFSLLISRATANAYLAFEDLREVKRLSDSDSGLRILAELQPENVDVLRDLSTFRLESDK